MGEYARAASFPAPYLADWPAGLWLLAASLCDRVVAGAQVAGRRMSNWNAKLGSLPVGARRDLLKVLMSPSNVRADGIRQLHESGYDGIVEVLADGHRAACTATSSGGACKTGSNVIRAVLDGLIGPGVITPVR